MDVGIISLVIYGVFILLAIVGSFVIIARLRNSDIEKDKLLAAVDLFKWAIASVAIATTTLIISNLFKEREQDIKELEYFDKYSEDIKTLEIAKRHKLTKYLSVVAPSGSLKDSWSDYLKVVEKEIADIDSLKKKKQEDLTPAEKENIEQQIEEIKSPISKSSNRTELAEFYQNEGFRYLLERNVSDAIIHFEHSEDRYPTYHQVYEIARYLRSNRVTLETGGDSEWQELYKTLVQSFSYGMPQRYRDEFVQKSTGS